jgi:hypothetical protein
MDPAGRHEAQKCQIPCPSFVRLGTLVEMIWIGDAVNWEAENKGFQNSLVHEIRVAT